MMGHDEYARSQVLDVLLMNVTGPDDPLMRHDGYAHSQSLDVLLMTHHVTGPDDPLMRHDGYAHSQALDIFDGAAVAVTQQQQLGDPMAIGLIAGAAAAARTTSTGGEM